MGIIPQPRDAETAHADGLEHPQWCLPGWCERQLVEVVHRGVGDLFVPSTESAAPELQIEVRRLRRDELRDGQQLVFGEEIELVRCDDGEVIATISVADLPRFCAVMISHAHAVA